MCKGGSVWRQQLHFLYLTVLLTFLMALMKYPREAAYRRKGLSRLTAPEGGKFQVVELGSWSSGCLFTSQRTRRQAGW